jgi:hypothetical protein
MEPGPQHSPGRAGDAEKRQTDHAGVAQAAPFVAYELAGKSAAAPRQRAAACEFSG